jgi:cytochrome c peroxidase
MTRWAKNPKGTPFSPQIFSLYGDWDSYRGTGRADDRRRAIARGEELFNATKINITAVAGLNDALNQPSIDGSCGTCHDGPNIGNHSVKASLNIGIADAGKMSPPALDISGLPVFKVKGPILRGLAARAPYFHNGSAATLGRSGGIL